MAEAAPKSEALRIAATCILHRRTASIISEDMKHTSATKRPSNPPNASSNTHARASAHDSGQRAAVRPLRASPGAYSQQPAAPMPRIQQQARGLSPRYDRGDDAIPIHHQATREVATLILAGVRARGYTSVSEYVVRVMLADACDALGVDMPALPQYAQRDERAAVRELAEDSGLSEDLVRVVFERSSRDMVRSRDALRDLVARLDSTK